MGDSHIAYSPRPDSTPEAELNALASAYAFVLQQHQERHKAAELAPDPNITLSKSLEETKEVSHVSRQPG